MNHFKLLESDGEGYFNTHTEWLTKEEAIVMLNEYAKDFPNSEWMIEQHDDELQEERHYNEKACDGWEDIYPIN
jgi:hypothetical protein